MARQHNYLLIKRHRATLEDRIDAAYKLGALMLPEAPPLYDKKRSKVGVGIKKGFVKPVDIHYKSPPKELGLEFLESPSRRIV